MMWTIRPTSPLPRSIPSGLLASTKPRRVAGAFFLIYNNLNSFWGAIGVLVDDEKKLKYPTLKRHLIWEMRPGDMRGLLVSGFITQHVLTERFYSCVKVFNGWKLCRYLFIVSDIF